MRAASGVPDVRVDPAGAAPPEGGLRDGEPAAPPDHPLHHDGAPLLPQGRGPRLTEAAAAQLRLIGTDRRTGYVVQG